ncbi:MAG TPA: POTRA domain-containing protein [Longimicrobium sp.]|nr:POTRA domain-containing protein [Longimicrobium sp.]
MRPTPFPLLIFCLATAPEAVRAQADSAAVEDVEFSGVRALEPALLRAVIETRESRCASPFYAPFCLLGDADRAERRTFLDPAALSRDEEAIRRTYATWGYPSATVRAAVDTLADGDVRVRFTVTEGAPVRVRSVVLRGAEALPSLTAADLPVRAGDVYALPRIQAAQRLVARRFGERGHAFVRVDAPPQPVEGGVADVVLEVAPGPVAVFGPTVVRAEPPLESDHVRRRLPYRPGQRFSPALLEHTAERLYDLPIVDSVDVRPAPVTWSDSVVETAITVGTGRAGRYEVRGVVGSSRCVGAEGFITHAHAFGAPRVLTLSASAANLLASELCGRDETGEFREPAYTVSASLAQPVGRASWLLLEGSFLRETLPGAYVRRGWQARVGVARELARGVDGTLAFAPERGDAAAAGAFFCGVYGECGAAGRGEDAYLLTPVEARLEWAPPNARAALGPPSPGPAWLAPERPRWVPALTLSVSAAGTPTGSDHAFARAMLEGSATRLVGRRVQVGARARLGMLSGADTPQPPQLRLFGGGPRGVRGVPANLLGPRILVARDTTFQCHDPEICAVLGPEDVFVRAAGGNVLVEASVEARVWATRGLQLAAFVDAGAVRARGDPDGPLGTRTESIVTPGIGVLALTPAGPIRVDLAYNPSPARDYPLLARNADGTYLLLGTARYDPYTFDGADGWTEFRRRLQLQLSMGTPF